MLNQNRDEISRCPTIAGPLRSLRRLGSPSLRFPDRGWEINRDKTEDFAEKTELKITLNLCDNETK